MGIYHGETYRAKLHEVTARDLKVLLLQLG
jgi:hypothetical protein